MLPGTRYLTHERCLAFVIGAGMLLASATLSIDFFADDYAFIAALKSSNSGALSRIFGLYEFASGLPVDNHELVRSGPLPWWTAPEFKLRFMRPLSSALFALDNAVFDWSVVGYHAHTLVWYLLLLAAVGVLLRRTLTRATSMLALMMFAVSGTHAEPLGWTAGRHVLVAATPSVLALLALLAYRERGFRAGRWLTPMAVAIGLCASESALGAVTYWCAYEAFGRSDGAPWRSRITRILTPMAIAVGYLTVYKVLGYGAAHSAAYVDPFGDPRRFAAVVATRLPLLLGEQLGEIPASMTAALPSAPFVGAGLVVTAVVALTLRSAWPSVPPSDRLTLRWLAIGALGALLVSAGGPPGSRVLLLPGIGAYAILAASTRAAWEHVSERAAGLWARRAYATFMLAVHLVMAPVIFLAGVSFYDTVGDATVALDRGLDRTLGSRALPGSTPRHVHVLCASDPMAAFYVAAVRSARAPDTVATWNMLSMARATHRIERRDARTLLLQVDRPMMQSFFETLFHAHEAPFAIAHTVELDDLRVKVLATTDGRPTELELAFHSPLEDPKLLFLAWWGGRLVEVRPPAIGEAIEIPWSPGPTGLF